MTEQKTFTLEEARALLPWLKEVSAHADHQMTLIQKDSAEVAAAKQSEIIQHWAETIFKLGALPKQPFTVDFDSGSDFYCWEYPEEDIYYRHDYHMGYLGRRPIDPSISQ
ncbi:MAG: DUF2203 family protein [Acidobacteria bacterium]|nr:DUF2203 family protein [Acidobacteriota bacterium]MCB9398076.1 DUF2203 family protein [Acidobacteriota bacterium]